MKSCTFIGHHDCPYDIKDKLSLKIESLIVNRNVRTFYVGTHGRFDELVYSVLCDLEIKYDIKFFVVLAYLSSSGNKIYDTEKTMFPEELCNTIKRYAIIKRNEYMIKNSDYLVCYANDTFSNTYKFIEYAKHRGIKVFNLGSVIT